MNNGAKIFEIKEAILGPIPNHNNVCKQIVKAYMSKWCFLLFVSLLPCFSYTYSQVSLNLKALFGQSNILESENISQDGLQASAEYHFRLKQKRIEFRPALGYRFTWNSSDYGGYFNSIDFDFNTAIYPFDFAGDCHCPTFSKSGDLFKKGFFLEVNPGVGYQTLTRVRSDPDDPDNLPIKSKNYVWKIGGSAGLDIGLSDKYTLTPLLSGTILSTVDWDGLNNDGSSGQLNDYVFLGTGIRITYNSDDKRRNKF
jgi:hypothetical protein